jgi:hypothetical protein
MRIIFHDISVLAGLGQFSYGAWLAYHPAGFMASGAGLLLAVLWPEDGFSGRSRSDLAADASAHRASGRLA